MEWYEQLKELCNKNNIEAMKDSTGTMVVYCPKIPSPEIKTNIEKTLPEGTETMYVECIKPSTGFALKAEMQKMLRMGGAMCQPVSDRGLEIIVQGEINDERGWGIIDELLAKDGFHSKWTVLVNGQEVHTAERDRILLSRKVVLEGSSRERILTDDDVLNVRIALANAQTVDDILNAM